MLVHCDQTVGSIRMRLDMQVGLGPDHTVLDRDPAPIPKIVYSPPNFRPTSIVATAGWNKMPLSTEVGLGPGDIVLNGDPATTRKGHSSPHFSADVYCGQTVAHLSNC